MKDNNRGLENKLAIVTSKLPAHEIPKLNLALGESEVFEIPDDIHDVAFDQNSSAVHKSRSSERQAIEDVIAESIAESIAVQGDAVAAFGS